MKKLMIALSASLLLLSFGACKPKQSAYRQVYEQAKQREIAQQKEKIQDVRREPAEQLIVSRPIMEESNGLRRERVQSVEGEDISRLKTFSVIIGSFQNRTNALALKERMEKEGYKATIAINDQAMYRVIVASYDNRSEAESTRDAMKSRFEGAWLLYRGQ